MRAWIVVGALLLLVLRHSNPTVCYAAWLIVFAMMAAAQPLPSVDALENLDAIQRMSQSAHADGDLLAALQ